ncbi:MAG: hypothetical protein ACXW3C_02945 [Pyrinomonadaceae bacterium]
MPAQIAKGTTHTIVIESTDCAKRTFADDKVITNLETLSKKGLDLTSVKIIENSCKLTAELTVTTASAFGPVAIQVQYSEGDKKGEETVILNVVKEEPLPPGPLVPGLDPEVDVMWGVVPQKIVKDNFGRRVGQNFYCIEIVIGNNTGYELQIASVGFELGPVGDAAKYLAQKLKTASKDIGNSSAINEAIKAEDLAATQAGMAAESEARAEIQKLNMEIASDPKEKEKHRLLYEQEKVRAGQLRTQATQSEEIAVERQKTAMAVVKARVELVKNQAERLGELSRVAYAQRLPVSSYRMTRGSLEHGQIWSPRNFVLNGVKAFGPFLTGFLPFFHVLNHRANFSEGINIISNPFEKGIEALMPDETIDQLQRLDEQILRDGILIPNNRQLRTRVFIAKDSLRLKKDFDGVDMRDDPMMVTLALGKLHLVGNKILYLNRVSVTSGPTGEVKPPPTVTPAATETFFHDKDKSITVTGTNLDNANVSADDPNAFEISKVSNTVNSITLKIKAKESATPGLHQLIVRTASPPAFTVPINVERPEPKLTPDTLTFTQAKNTKSNSTEVIKSSLTEDKEYEITVQGSYLQGAKLKPLDNGGNHLEVAKQPDQTPIDGKSFTATIRVPKGTPEKTYEFEVRNDRPVNDNKPAKFKVDVKPQDAPTIKDTQPISKDSADKPVIANPGRSQDVTITINGDNLNGAEVVVKEGGNATGKLEPVKPESVNTNKEKLTATIKIKPEAAPAAGPVDYELQVKTGSKPPVDFKLQVQPQKAPTITSPTDPLPGKPGQTLSLVVVGANLEGAKIKPQTGLQVKSGPTPNGDGTQFTAEITIAGDALPAGATEKIFTVEVTNSNTTAPSATFKIKVTP